MALVRLVCGCKGISAAMVCTVWDTGTSFLRYALGNPLIKAVIFAFNKPGTSH